MVPDEPVSGKSSSEPEKYTNRPHKLRFELRPEDAMFPPVFEAPTLISRLTPFVVRPVRPRQDPWDLLRELDAARAALGERMYFAGIDDGETGAMIAAVEAELRGATDLQIRRLRAERGRLIRRLADAALENDAPLPGADAEFERAWAAQTACDRAGLLN
jgi:hypothetical protein